MPVALHGLSKSQLALTGEIAAELLRIITQPQLCLSLNRCAVHTLWNNNSDLIKQTRRERRIRAAQRTQPPSTKFAAKQLGVHKFTYNATLQ